ncbi:Methyltransferase domain-containing protein [Thermomonospora echinospora]|uniref:Methyltransferase domain-containing protein n=1 Tax=Thermomonospora echinospora TaxID=1992 RepID=A0A1H5V8C0_9ACTN|nr:methyltransferase domain-containing protein [Thermomonospora echinospora]SEF83434.1 Methyltransferase domain-containing protein [Thermomonospora echinospora]
MLPLPATPPERSISSLRDDPGDGDDLGLYWTFYWAVAAAQLQRWLPEQPSRVLDISGGRTLTAARAAAAGHTVVEVLAAPPAAEAPHPDPRAPSGPPDGREAARSARGRAQGTAGRRHRVVADVASLGFLADGSVDAVIAEDRVLSRHLVTETIIGELARVLRPGGRMLLSVDSLMLGMAILAEQNFWAHLSDVPRAEVLLVPWPDGTITRCFWSDQLRELLTEAGFEVEWIRPRTVLSPSTVEHVLTADAHALGRLVRTELTALVTDESVGIHLLASATRR